MVYKNRLSGLVIALGLFSGSAFSECYYRATTIANPAAVIERMADSTRQVVPYNNQTMCRVMFRAYIKGSWHTAQGEAVGDNKESLDQLCARATSTGRISILESVAGTRVSGNQEMICTDEPKIEYLPKVSLGEVIRESQVRPHRIQPDQFQYRGSYCRWFIESSPAVGSVDMSQGIICRAPENKFWRVVDKW